MRIDIKKIKSKILVVDDEELLRDSLSQILSNFNYSIDTAASAENAIRLLEKSPTPYQVVITDLKMNGMSGHELLKWIKKRYPNTEVVIITAFATIDNAVQAIKDGASDYITKPIDPNRLRILVQKTLERQQLVSENQAFKKWLRERHQIVGISDPIREVYETVERVADTNATVLIEGASGTGKEVVARTIHNRSGRRHGPFVILNCAALPATLLENELFGHEKEAFTGASSLKKGRFEIADGGTIFLDEITEMSLEGQSNFLRVLEDGSFCRIGGSEQIDTDVRIIAASNKEILDRCERGLFRYDLFYRLNVVPIKMPLLRERREDIPILIQTFLEEFALQYNKPNIQLEDNLVEVLSNYHWPGNVRELKNTLERAMIMSSGKEINMKNIPPMILEAASQSTVKQNPSSLEVGRSLREMEEVMIRKTLESVDGHRKKASKILGISVRTLQYKIKQYEIKA